MNADISNDKQIQAEIEQLKLQFANTKDLYREVCMLLFFRYGIAPTANKLYQLVHRGSMSAPSEALNKFWLELREKSRTHIEAPDLPDELKESAGSFISSLWRRAQEAAAANFASQIEDTNKMVMQIRLDAEIALKDKAEIDKKLTVEIEKNNIAKHLIDESKTQHAVDISTIDSLKELIHNLQNECTKLALSLDETRTNFSQDIDKLNGSLIKAENQYRSFETKALLEIDKERHIVIQMEKENLKSREALNLEQGKHQKEISLYQNTISDLRENIGMLNGKLSEIAIQQKNTERKLKHTQSKFVLRNARLIRKSKT